MVGLRLLCAAALLATGCPQPGAVEAPVTADVPRLTAESTGPLADANEAFGKQDWERAAIAYAERAHDPATAPGAVSLAEQRLAECLHHLGLPRTSSVIFRDLATGEGEAARESFRWLARLSLELPAADLSAALGGFPERSRTAALADLAPAVQSRAHYLLGRHLRVMGKFEAAIAELERVEGDDAPEAQIVIALVNVQQRLSVPTVVALEIASVKAMMEANDQERRRLRELATLLEAQTFFSAANRSHADEAKTLVLDRKQLFHAIETFDSIPKDSELYGEARWQGAWARFALGDLAAAKAAIEAALATADAYFPEAELLAADVEWRLREDAKARAALQRFTERYGPVLAGLKALENELTTGAEPEAKVVELLARVRKAPQDLPASIAKPLLHALRNRQIAAHVDDLQLIEKEEANLSRLSKAFQSSKAGSYARSAADAAADEQRDWLRTIVTERVAAAREELASLLEKAERAKVIVAGKKR